MSLDDELLQDAEHDAAAVQYVRTHLPQELQEVFSDELLYYFLDLLVEYLVESGLLEAEGDADGYVEIDQEAISDHLAKKAVREKMGDFSAEDLCFVVQAMLDFEMGEDE